MTVLKITHTMQIFTERERQLLLSRIHTNLWLKVCDDVSYSDHPSHEGKMTIQGESVSLFQSLMALYEKLNY